MADSFYACRITHTYHPRCWCNSSGSAEPTESHASTISVITIGTSHDHSTRFSESKR